MQKNNYSSLLIRLVGMICCLFIFEKNSLCQDEKFKALFIYNFINYIDWPKKVNEKFKIAIIGNNDLATELKSFATQKKIGTLTIIVVSSKSSADVKDCQIVFLSHNNIDELPNLIVQSKQNNILLITETPNSCAKGAGLNFILKNGSIKFEISKTNIESAGLKVNSGLFNLGISVN
jgi:hypothetical protein